MTIKQQDVLPNIQIKNNPHAAPFVDRLFEKGVGVAVVRQMILDQLVAIQEADIEGRTFSRWMIAIQDCAALETGTVRMLGIDPDMFFGQWLRTGAGRTVPPRSMRMSLLLSIAQGAFLGLPNRPAPAYLRRWSKLQLPEGLERDSLLPKWVSRALFGAPGHTYADVFVNLYPLNDQIGFAQFLWKQFASSSFPYERANDVMDAFIDAGITCPTFVRLPPIPSGRHAVIDLFTKLDFLPNMPKRIGQALVSQKLRTPAKLMELNQSLTDLTGFGRPSVATLREVLSEAGYRPSDFSCLRE